MPGPKPSKKKRRIRKVTKQAERIEKAIDNLKVERRGGFRANAGRPPGTRNMAKRFIGIREITDDIVRQGKVPLRVMINNMIFYDEKAVFLEEQMHDAIADHVKSFSEKGFLHALELMAQMGDARMKAQKCACDAAPFLHPRLSSVEMSVNHTADRRPDPDAPISEVEEEFRKLRSAPIIYQPDVDVEEEDDANAE